MTVAIAVFDCVVYLQAAARPAGPARSCLEGVQSGHCSLAISAVIRAEINDVLHRPEIRQKFPSLTDEAVAVFLSDIDALAKVVADVPALVTFPRDPKDEPYLNLAFAAGAKYLVTWDKDLLDLMSDVPEGIAFRNRFPGLVILTPVAFLQELARFVAPAPRTDASDAQAGG